MLPILKVFFMFFNRFRLLPAFAPAGFSALGHSSSAWSCAHFFVSSLLQLKYHLFRQSKVDPTQSFIVLLSFLNFSLYHLLPSDLLYTCYIYILQYVCTILYRYYRICFFKIDHYCLLCEMGLSALNSFPPLWTAEGAGETLLEKGILLPGSCVHSC